MWVLLAGCQQGKAIGGILTLFIVYGFLYSPFSMVFSTSPGQKGDLSSWASKPGHGRQKNLNRSAWPKLLKTCASFMTEGSAV